MTSPSQDVDMDPTDMADGDELDRRLAGLNDAELREEIASMSAVLFVYILCRKC